LHFGSGIKVGKISIFKESSLSKCKAILITRKKQNLKYQDIELPGEIDSYHGFHIECYRKFVALSKAQRIKMDKEFADAAENNTSTTEDQETVKTAVSEQQPSQAASYVTRSCITSPKPSSSSGVFPLMCIFCGLEKKKSRGVFQKLSSALTTNFEEKIKKYAQWKNDQKMLAQISDISFAAKEVKYHGLCRLQYEREAKRTPQGIQQTGSFEEEKTLTYWHKTRLAHQEAFGILKEYLRRSVVDENEVQMLIDINNHYRDIFKEITGNEFDETNHTVQKLEGKIRSEFGEEIHISKGATKRGNIIYNSSLSVEEVIRKESLHNQKDEVKVREVAFLLRKKIMEMEYDPLPEELKLNDIKKGEISIPDLLLKFFTYLIGGPDSRRSHAESKKIRINSLSQDTIFAATSGKRKPAKHLKLGIALKSLTGSKKVIQILNRYGHCPSYNTIQELETELTYEANKNMEISPYGMKKGNELGTGIAWDNYDCFVETTSGKNTLHDTVGICYQSVVAPPVAPSVNILECIDKSAEDASSITNKNTSNKRKRRAYEPKFLNIEPYRKKPKMTEKEFLPIKDERRNIEPVSRIDGEKKDFCWMITVNHDALKTTPMWVGWNSRSIPSSKEDLKKIFYVPQINQSPTSHAVVVETMKRSQQLARECNMDSIAITYDLAIAKIAMQVQAFESPRFDNVFIAMGAFHLEMAFFQAVGKYIDESGGPYILAESGLLASNSIKSFLNLNSYNRRKRLHGLLSLAFEILHYKAFEKQQDRDEFDKLITEIQSNSESHHDSKEMNDLFSQYSKFKEDTESGKHGKTAQYWIIYINMIKLYRTFIRSIRESDIDLYIYCLPLITNLFFTFNQPNYARWTTRYHDNLLKLKDSHPLIYENFKRGLFGIKRTEKSFSRSPIDLTLEQTINADASSQKTGITNLTNSIAARQRWADSHFLRTEIISEVMQDLSLDQKEDVSRDLKPNRIEKDNLDLDRLMTTIVETTNPFDDKLEKDKLFNISTGRAASEETSAFLLNVNNIGEKARIEFIEKTIESPKRFEESIKRQKLKTFSSEVPKRQVIGNDNKIKAVTMMRDLFGSVLYLSLEKDIDMGLVLQYPLTPVPLSLSHIDGSMLKTPKVTLLKNLESRIVSIPPNNIDITVVDAMFYLHLQTNLPETFGAVSRHILKSLCSHESKVIHVIFDKTISPSIKDSERDSRMLDRHSSFQIKGKTQKRPDNWLAALRNDQFKESIVKYLIESWKESDKINILGEKVVYANCGDKVYSFRVSGNEVEVQQEDEYFCMHEEADSRMIYHLTKMEMNKRVVIRTSDTDVLIIALGCFEFIRHLNIWLEVGLFSKNTLRFININQLFTTLGSKLSKSLPGYHAFTGSDYTAAFSRKGKLSGLKLLEKENEFQETFGKLGEEEISDATFEQLESFACRMYGMKKVNSINEVI
jgi:hypothetical protein